VIERTLVCKHACPSKRGKPPTSLARANQSPTPRGHCQAVQVTLEGRVEVEEGRGWWEVSRASEEQGGPSSPHTRHFFQGACNTTSVSESERSRGMLPTHCDVAAGSEDLDVGAVTGDLWEGHGEPRQTADDESPSEGNRSHGGASRAQCACGLWVLGEIPSEMSPTDGVRAE
jgi:hypothetical protein